MCESVYMRRDGTEIYNWNVKLWTWWETWVSAVYFQAFDCAFSSLTSLFIHNTHNLLNSTYRCLPFTAKSVKIGCNDSLPFQKKIIKILTCKFCFRKIWDNGWLCLVFFSPHLLSYFLIRFLTLIPLTISELQLLI